MSGPSELLSDILSGTQNRTAASPGECVALAYCRVSTDMQSDRGLSIPAQRKAIEEYAAQQRIPVLETFEEAASSFQDESKRVEFLRMIERAKSDPQVSAILVHESSRFCRHPWQTPQLIGELQDAGVRVISVTEPEHDVNTVMGMWMQKVMEAKNASYSMEVAFHTRKGMRQNVNTRDPQSGWCWKNGGRPPWGYRTVRTEQRDVRGRPRFKATWELDASEVSGRPVWEWTRDMLIRAGDGGSLDSIRDMLNAAGVPTALGNRWCTSSVRSMLEPHMLLQYAGHGTWAVRKKRRRRWNPSEDWEIVPDAHPAIISEEEARHIGRVREKARAWHGKPAARMSRARTQASPYLLTGGLFTCRRCGANMIGHKNRGYSYYLCATSQYQRGSGCGRAVLVRQSLLESEIWDSVSRWIGLFTKPRSGLLKAANREINRLWKSSGKAEARSLRDRLERVDRKTGNIRTAIEDGIADTAWANERLTELRRERVGIVGDLTATPTAPPEIEREVLARYAADLPRLLDTATDEERRRLARHFVETVELDPDAREVEIQLKLPEECARHMEAAAGVEPANKGFADLCLTTWLRRRRLQVERKAGFEPATHSLGSCCSTN